jgi:hypothetical protein
MYRTLIYLATNFAIILVLFLIWLFVAYAANVYGLNLNIGWGPGDYAPLLGTGRLRSPAGFLFHLRHGGVFFIPSDLQVVSKKAHEMQAHHGSGNRRADLAGGNRKAADQQG